AILAEALVARRVETTLFYGARTGAELFSLDFFRERGVSLVLTTEDGSAGEHGRVTAPLERHLAERRSAAAVYACGPEAMMAAVARMAMRFACVCHVALERVMGCGLGGCYSCVVVKGLFLEEREGHPAPRILETPAGMLNAIGLQGIGVRRFVDEKLPELRARNATVIVNVCGTTIDEYVEVSRILSDADGVAAIELNISCPNIKEGGIQFGCSLSGTFDVVSSVRKATRLPIFPKLTPNVTDVASFARAAEEGGADAVSLVNTFLAMVIDIETR